MRVRSLSRKIPWSRKWQPTPVFSHGKFHEQRSLTGYSMTGSQRIGHDGLLSTRTHAHSHTHTHTHTHPTGPMLGASLLCFLPEVEWTTRCPDSKEGRVSLQWLNAGSYFMSQDEG